MNNAVVSKGIVLNNIIISMYSQVAIYLNNGTEVRGTISKVSSKCIEIFMCERVSTDIKMKDIKLIQTYNGVISAEKIKFENCLIVNTMIYKEGDYIELITTIGRKLNGRINNIETNSIFLDKGNYKNAKIHIWNIHSVKLVSR